ncbi:hypothetical protein ACFX13_019872 [Malus domestica]
MNSGVRMVSSRVVELDLDELMNGSSRLFGLDLEERMCGFVDVVDQKVGSRKNKYASKGRSGAQRDGRTYDNVVRGNKTWVSKADLVSKWRPDCDMSSGGIVGGKAENMADLDKGKNTMEEDEEFMKAEKENNEQI